jgi:hypothetical protein
MSKIAAFSKSKFSESLTAFPLGRNANERKVAVPRFTGAYSASKLSPH